MASISGLVHHEHVPTAIRVAQTVGITSATFLAGYITSATILAAPGLLEAPTGGIVARQFKKLYDIGKSTSPALSLLSSVVFGYLATKVESSSSRAFTLYTAAAVLIPATVPYTLIVMAPTNTKLLDKADSLSTSAEDKASATAGAETAHSLLDKWGTLNLGRAGLALMGAVCGTLAVLSQDKANALNSVSRVGLSSGANRLG